MRKLLRWLREVLGNWHRLRAPLERRLAVGRDGEAMAARYLRGQGWRVVARNWRAGRDELDIVAREGENLVFVEVKTRQVPEGMLDTAGLGFYAVDARKRKALLRACRAYLVGLRRRPRHFRFDVIEIKIHKNGTRDLQHHRGVALFPKFFQPKTHG